jgi:MFS family permease
MTLPASDRSQSARLEAAAYSIAFFSFSSMAMMPMVLSMWLDDVLGDALVAIGLVLAARQIVGLVYSIHAGAWFDRSGVRLPALVLAFLAAVVPVALPLVPVLPVIAMLLMVNSLGTKVSWMSAQALAAQDRARSAVLAGRLVFATALARLIGTPLVGAASDRWGSIGALVFLSVWGFGAVAALGLAPPSPRRDDAPRRPATLRTVLVPDPRDYRATLATLRLPGVPLYTAIGVVRHLIICMETSFYVVFLYRLGYPATAIGWLIAVSAFSGGVGALFTARVLRRASPRAIVLGGAIAGFATFPATPLAPVLPLLFAGALCRGVVIAAMQSVAVTTLSTHVPAELRGRVIGLQQVAISLAWLVLPPLMGWVAATIGLDRSFHVVGGLCIAGSVAVALAGLGARRVPVIRDRSGDVPS